MTVNNQISKCNKAVLRIKLGSGQLKSKAAIIAGASCILCSWICNKKKKRDFAQCFAPALTGYDHKNNKAVGDAIDSNFLMRVILNLRGIQTWSRS